MEEEDDLTNPVDGASARAPSPRQPVGAALVRPVVSVARIPLTEAVARNFPARGSVFAPVEPGPTLADIARATAQRVVDRLETFEQSPLVRELRQDVDEVVEEHGHTRDRLLDLRANLDNLTRCHNELADDVNLTVERIENLRRQLEARLDELERVSSQRDDSAERLRDAESRLRMTEFCLLFVMCFAAVLLALLLKI